MPHLKHIGRFCLVALAFLGLYATAGCAFGRHPITGAIVGGVELGKLEETADQMLGTAAGLLPPPFGTIAEFALPAIAAGGLIHGRSRTVAKRESESAYDEGKRDAEAAAAAAKRAYDEARLREAYKRAKPESFDPPPPDAGVGGPVPV